MNPDDPERWLAGSPVHAFHDSPPPGVNVQVEFGAASRRSALRPVNEDHYLILRLGRHQETLMTSLPERDAPLRFEEYGYAMLVADGLGGTGAGELASRLAIGTLVHLATRFGRWNVRIDDNIAREVMDRAERFYRGVDSTLLYKSLDEAPELQTTLTVAYSAGRDLFLAHVGHSRAYLFRNQQFVRLTEDHTLTNVRGGSRPFVSISVTARDLHHVLTESLGTADLAGPKIDIDRLRLADGDIVLLCTNGLTDMVGEDQIGDVLRSARPSGEQSATLVNLAVDAGGDDDVTALVARYRIPDPLTEPVP
jgi:serine/threonine protein phosphatase PrpC